MATTSYFPTVEKIKFEGKDSKNPMRSATTIPKRS